VARLTTLQSAFLFVLLVTIPGISIASEPVFEFRSQTIFRLFERENKSGDSLQVLPIYEYLDINYGDIEKIGFSMHLHGWARADLGDGDYFEDDSDGELLYGYLEYTPPSETYNVKVGRQHLFAGVINDSFDGLGIVSLVGDYVSVNAFGGIPTGYEEENGQSNDGIVGGRLAITFNPTTEFGVSHKFISDDDTSVENLSGLDSSLQLTSFLSLYGLSSWNHNTEGWREHTYEADLYIGPLLLIPSFQMIQYDDFFDDSALGVQPFQYLQDSEEELTIMGADLVWQFAVNLEVGIKLKQYEYDLRSETSQYYATLLKIKTDNATQYGLEAGSMVGESDNDRYNLYRGYLYWDTPLEILENWFISSEIIYITYQEEIYGQDRSIFYSVGCGKELIEDRFKFALSGDYSTDPYFDDDFRMMLVGTFTY